MRNEIPFFTPHYLDLARSPEMVEQTLRPPTVEVRGVDVSIDATRKVIAQQNGFIRRYVDEPTAQRQATWLLALAACTANNDTTPGLLTMCLDQKMELPDIVPIAIMANSDRAVHFLTSRGMQWRDLMVQDLLGDHNEASFNASSPHQGLLEHALNDPKRGNRHHRVINLVPVLEAVSRHVYYPPLRFVQGILDSGQIDALYRMPSAALGLKDSRAYWLSQCVASLRFGLIDQAFTHFKQFPQPVLDEALLACAMVSSGSMMDEDRLNLDRLVTKLVASGANPDQTFDFGLAATEALTGERFHERVSFDATTRQWAIFAALKTTRSKAWNNAFLPKPWPKLADGTQWLDKLFTEGADHVLNGHPKAVQALLGQVLDLRGGPNLSDVLNAHAPLLQKCADSGSWAAIDAIIVSKPAQSSLGGLPAARVIDLVCQWGGASEPQDLSDRRTMELFIDRVEGWWEAPRLDKVIAWMPPDQQAVFKGHVESFRADWQKFVAINNPRTSDHEAILLSLSSMVIQAQSLAPSPRKSRRTL